MDAITENAPLSLPGRAVQEPERKQECLAGGGESPAVRPGPVPPATALERPSLPSLSFGFHVKPRK